MVSSIGEIRPTPTSNSRFGGYNDVLEALCNDVISGSRCPTVDQRGWPVHGDGRLVDASCSARCDAGSSGRSCGYSSAGALRRGASRGTDSE